MSQTLDHERISLAAGRRLADKWLAELSPHCERIEVAGSIRRKRKTVGDVELVAIAKPHHREDLFGKTIDTSTTALHEHCDALCSAGKLKRDAGGERQQRFIIAPDSGDAFTLDLYITTPDRFGVIFAIRTGSATFAKSLVTPTERGGRLTNGLAVCKGRVWNEVDIVTGMIDFTERGRRVGKPFRGVRPGAKPLFETPQEADFLDLAGGWVEPEDRR